MIRLKKLIEEKLTPLQQRKKRFTLMFEGGEVGFELDAKEFQDLNDFAKQVGADVTPFVEMELEEKEKPKYLQMTSAELEEGGYVLKIDKSVFDGVEEIVDLGLAAKKWYEEMNTKILSAMEESDGCLFLLLLGIFASFSRLSDNFKLASQVYTGIKRDLSDPKTEAQLLRMIQMSSSEMNLRI
jgi:hypothetical protein